MKKKKRKSYGKTQYPRLAHELRKIEKEYGGFLAERRLSGVWGSAADAPVWLHQKLWLGDKLVQHKLVKEYQLGFFWAAFDKLLELKNASRVRGVVIWKDWPEQMPLLHLLLKWYRTWSK